MSVAVECGIVGLDEGVELIDAAQGVLIGGVAVKELVLDKALQGAELGKITAQYPATVHESEGAPDLSLLLHDRPEGAAILPVVVEGLVDLVPVGLDEFAQGRGGAEMVFLAVQKEVKQLTPKASVILVDFHAEATSEKIAMGRMLDGKVSAVVGTHTHVQTADEIIFDDGEFTNTGT